MDELENLFAEWQEQRPEYRGHFAEDGIVNEKHWAEAPVKVLFVLKETNDYRADLRELLRREGPFSRIWRNVGRWTYGIQQTTRESFPSFAEADEHKADALQSCAVMNLKKTSGTRDADMDEVKEYARKDAELIRREIDLICPQVVVCGYTYDMLEDALYAEVKPKETSDLVFEADGMAFVDYWHPGAYSFPDKMLYYTLSSLYMQSLGLDRAGRSQ